jgi:hypothetical protein
MKYLIKGLKLLDGSQIELVLVNSSKFFILLKEFQKNFNKISIKFQKKFWLNPISN